MLALSGCGNSGSNIFQQLFHIGEQNEDTAAPTTEEVIPTTTEYDTEEPNTVGVEDTEEESISSDVEFQTFTYTHQNYDGYLYEITITLSPWILESQTDVLESAWAQVGDDKPLPSTDGMNLRKYADNLYIGYDNNGFYATMTEMYFSVGTISIKNITDGWSFSTDHTGGCNLQFWWGSDTDRYDGLMLSANRSMTSKIYYSSNTKYKEGGLEVRPSMKSDYWGPVTFVLAHAENITPNYPEGEFRPEILVGYLEGYIDNPNGERNRVQIRIPIYDETQSSSGWVSDNSGSQGSSNSNIGEGICNREYIASEQKYKNYHFGYELDLVDIPEWGAISFNKTPENETNENDYYLIDIEASWQDKTLTVISDAYDPSRSYVIASDTMDQIYKEMLEYDWAIGGSIENLGQTNINGCSGCLYKQKLYTEDSYALVFYSDDYDQLGHYEIYIDTNSLTDERIPEALEYLNQHLRKIN